MKKRYYLFILLGIIAVYTLVMAVLAPVMKIRSLNAQYHDDLYMELKSKHLSDDASYRILKIEEAFLNSRLLMAETDSICLVIDLADSLIMIEISGVVVHSAKIPRIKGQRFFSGLEVPAVTQLLSTPLHVRETHASIPKEPIIIKRAPKDTIEASAPSKIPDTVDIESICFSILTDKGIIIDIRQIEKAEDNKLRKFRHYQRNSQIGEVMKGVLRFRIPDYYPAVVISIPRADAKTIYRAIPKKAQIAVKV